MLVEQIQPSYNFGLSFEGVLTTSLPYSFPHSPSLSPMPLSKSLLMLLTYSYRKTWDPVGELGQPVVACFEPDL